MNTRMQVSLRLRMAAVGMLLTATGTFAAPTMEELAFVVDQHIQDLRDRRPTEFKHDVPPELLPAFIDLLEVYRDDDDERIRIAAYALDMRTAGRSEEPEVRRQAVSRLIRGLNDSAALVRQAIPRWLLRYTASDFEEPAREAIRKAVEAGNVDPSILRLCGVAQVEELIPTLRDIVEREDEPQWQHRAWAARLALARMGDREQIRVCIERFRAEENEMRRLNVLLPDLAYIRQPQTLRMVIEHLNSDANVPGEGDIMGVVHAHQAADLLAEMLEDFPTTRKFFYSDAEIHQLRQWVSRQQRFNIRR